MKRLFKRYIAPALERSWLKGSVLSWVGMPLLWPLSKIVWYAWRLSHWAAQGELPQKLPVPLLVVGNVYVGGVGKTPLVIALVEHCQNKGIRVGVVSRGYRAYENDQSTAPKPHLIVAKDLAIEVGDEPMLIFKRTGAPVCICPNRHGAALHLLGTNPDLDLIISDDGLQSNHLLPDMTVCVFDDRGLGNGMTLPAGPLREPWPRIPGLHHSQLARYQWVMNTGDKPSIAGHRAHRSLAKTLTNARGEELRWEELNTKPLQRILALAGVARPEQFFQMLKDQGLQLDACVALPDHADLEDYERVISQVKKGGTPTTLLCTQKDAVKLWAIEPEALAVTLELSLPADFLAEFDLAFKALQETGTGFSNPENADIIGR